MSIIIVHLSFVKGGSKLYPSEGGVWKIKKGGGRWKYGAGAGFHKRRGWHLSYLIFTRFIIFTFSYFFTLSRSGVFARRFEKSKIDFWQKATVELSKHPFDICLNPLTKWKEGWYVWLGHVDVAWEWGNCLKGMEQKRGEGNKDLKKGDQAGSRGGCLKNRGSWNPLLNYGNILTFGSVWCLVAAQSQFSLIKK